MLEKKLWPNFIYAMILFVVCVTVWQISTDSEGNFSNVAVYSLYTSNFSGYAYPINALPLDDYRRLIDIHNFTFTMLNLPCNDSAPLLLVLVHSNPKNFETREIIRETWGRNTPQVKVLFMSGLVRSKSLEVRLEKENEEHGDIIQGSFLDAYRNMTYKHVMVFKYAIYHCPQAKYILKTDDDVFVNMPFMIKFLTDLSPFGGSKMIFCTLRTRIMVVRSYRSKWRVSFKEYPEKMYPPYCPGWAVLYSPDVVFDLYKEAQKSELFWIDDVHITGTLADKVHLTHVDVDKWVLSHKAMHEAFESSQLNHAFLYGGPNIKNEDIKAFWEYMNRDS